MRRVFPLVILCLALSVSACQSKKGAGSVSGLKKVHFDYDSATIKPSMVPVLQSGATYLQKHKNVKVVVEGHCDERGTNEYNLALGDRRATITKNFLASQGVKSDRLRTVSFGEEKPLAKGTDESSYYLNRRAEFSKQ